MSMHNRVAVVLVLIISLALHKGQAQTTTATPQPPAAGVAFHEAIRSNSIDALKALIATHGLEGVAADGLSPLVLASAFGTAEAVRTLLDAGADPRGSSAAGLTALHVAVRDPMKVRVLLDRGADVNAASQAGTTPLIIAASTSGSAASIRLLLDKGAQINTADSTGLTPLLAAAAVDDPAMVRMLLDAGARHDGIPALLQPPTPLMAAASNGNLQVAKWLLDRGPDVNAVSGDAAGIVRNGQVAFGRVTALHLAVSAGNAGLVDLLLKAGANPNLRDVRGMTPLMFAVGTDHPKLGIIKLLRAAGADPAIRSNIDEDVPTWARKFNHPESLRALGLAPGSMPVPAPAHDAVVVTSQAAVERSLPLLEASSARVLRDGGCVACHAQPITATARFIAEKRGWRVDGPATSYTQTVAGLSATSLLQPRFTGGAPDGQVYSGLALTTAERPPAVLGDALAYYLAARQRADGSWHSLGATRAPIQDGDFSRTALAIKSLSRLGTPALRSEFDERIKRATSWIARQDPVSTEDRVMQILGMTWGSAPANDIRRRVSELARLQRVDGGWAQTPPLASDAYATGQALYALSVSGATGLKPATFERAAMFLRRTQQADGSWHVVNRAMKIQPYFESGFPYGHDQWVSHAATAWAVMGLASGAR